MFSQCYMRTRSLYKRSHRNSSNTEEMCGARGNKATREARLARPRVKNRVTKDAENVLKVRHECVTNWSKMHKQISSKNILAGTCASDQFRRAINCRAVDARSGLVYLCDIGKDYRYYKCVADMRAEQPVQTLRASVIGEAVRRGDKRLYAKESK